MAWSWKKEASQSTHGSCRKWERLKSQAVPWLDISAAETCVKWLTLTLITLLLATRCFSRENANCLPAWKCRCVLMHVAGQYTSLWYAAHHSLVSLCLLKTVRYHSTARMCFQKTTASVGFFQVKIQSPDIVLWWLFELQLLLVEVVWQRCRASEPHRRRPTWLDGNVLHKRLQFVSHFQLTIVSPPSFSNLIPR